MRRDIASAISRESLEHAIELRERLKSRRERDFTDAQIGVVQKITRFFKPSARDVLDEIYAGYLLEIFAEMIGVNVDDAFATLVRESSSPEYSSINLRAFQIATGSALFRQVAFSNSAADNIFIIP